jgi:hypothetical protein
MKLLSRLYQVLLPVCILVLGYCLYAEYQTRELAVTGARIDSIELHLRHVECMANALELKDVQQELRGARRYFEMAVKAYRKKDFEVARIHIHNTMWDLDIATHLLLVRTSAQEEAVKDKQP